MSQSPWNTIPSGHRDDLSRRFGDQLREFERGTRYSHTPPKPLSNVWYRLHGKPAVCSSCDCDCLHAGDDRRLLFVGPVTDRHRRSERTSADKER